MSRSKALVPLVALGTAALLGACGGDSGAKDADDASGSVAVQFSPDTKEVTEDADGDVKITSTDGTLVLAVIADSVVIQLSDSLRQTVADSIKAGTNGKGGLGDIIGNAVSAAVSTAMGFEVRVPARDVEHLRFENGELHFDVKGGKVRMNSTSTKSDGTTSDGTGGRFAEDDARRFMEAVKAAQARGTIQ